jgi:hypothetical protein
MGVPRTLNRPGFIERATRRDEVEARIRRRRRRTRQLLIDTARDFWVVQSSGHYVYRACSCVAQFGEELGYSGREARMLASLGRALESLPELEEEILQGRISPDAGAFLAKLFKRPNLIRKGDDWIAWARKWSAQELHEKVRERLREEESGESVSTHSFTLTASGLETFERAWQLACRKKDKALTHGEAVEVLADDYLDRYDIERKTPRKRRMAKTPGHPGRKVAAEEVRKLLERKGDRCNVPFCDLCIWLEKAHDVPHREGGGREAKDLHNVCWEHHGLFDTGWMRIEGTPENPTFRTADGDILGARGWNRKSRAPPG